MFRFRLYSFPLLLVLITTFLVTGCTIGKPAKSGLQVIITNNQNASVFLDGQYLDKTPYIGKNLNPGEHLLRIEPDNPKFPPHELTIQLRPQLLTVVTWKPGDRPETSGGIVFEMESLAQKKRTELAIISLPDGAIVSIDGQKREFTPLTIEGIEPGNHELEVTLPSYEAQKHTISVLAGHRMNLTVKLARLSTALSNDQITPSPTTTELVSELATAAATTSSAQPVRKAVDLSTSRQLHILSTNFFVDGKEVLKVRDSSTNAGKELGFIEVGSSAAYLNETYNGWHKIDFNGKIGWVSGQYTQLK